MNSLLLMIQNILGMNPVWAAVKTELSRRVKEASGEFKVGQARIWADAEAAEKVLLNTIALTVLKGE